MKVLIACEFSGRIRDAFIAKGHDAWSCDLLPTERPGPHIQGDILEILNDGWDLMIAHPPCTYLSRAGARWLYPKGKLDRKRFLLGQKARNFFMALLSAKITKICVENPTPFKIFALPSHSQVIQPFEFGEPYSKRTLLWLLNIEPLRPAKIVAGYVPFICSNTGWGKKQGQVSHRGISHTSHMSSVTFQGIANAMADQWG